MTEKQPSRVKNLTIAGILALTGFVALIIALLALILGLWLDSLFGMRGPVTVCLLVLSVPMSLYVMTRMALSLVRRIQLSPVQLPDGKKQDDDVISSSAVKEDESFE